MALPSKRRAQRARARIGAIHASLAGFELVCSGTLSKRMMKCGKPNCRCANDPAARHGPYFQWMHMRDGKLAHRYVTEQQAQVLRQAIANYRQVKKLLREWEENLLELDRAAESDARSPAEALVLDELAVLEKRYQRPRRTWVDVR